MPAGQYLPGDEAHDLFDATKRGDRDRFRNFAAIANGITQTMMMPVPFKKAIVGNLNFKLTLTAMGSSVPSESAFSDSGNLVPTG